MNNVDDAAIQKLLLDGSDPQSVATTGLHETISVLRLFRDNLETQQEADADGLNVITVAIEELDKVLRVMEFIGPGGSAPDRSSFQAPAPGHYS